MKKLIVTLLCVAMIVTMSLSFVACDGSKDEGDLTAKTIKIGMICIGDKNSTYDANFLDAMERTMKKLGMSDDQLVLALNVPEGQVCTEQAVQLAEAGCDIIFADSFGHEQYVFGIADEYPNISFCHATGTKAQDSKLDNVANAFASIYEGRYLTGVAAGLKLLEKYDTDNDGAITDDEAKVGYVGAYTYAEVISGYTAFYLGVKSIVPNATMSVRFTGEWFNYDAEYAEARALIKAGAKIISQHADSMGAPNACEAEGVPNISYNGATGKACPNTYIASSRIDWAPYFEYIITQKIAGKAIDKDYVGTLATGSVQVDVGNAAAPQTKEKIAEVKAQLEAGTLHVFDVSKFTVTKTAEKNKDATVDENKHLTGYMANVHTDFNTAGDTQVVINGVFYESKERSAPYFEARIDGINTINSVSN